MMEEIRLDAFCDSVRDGTHDTPKPVKEGCYLVTSKAIKNNTVYLDECYYISQEDYDKINKRSLVEKWDVLMTMIGSVGRLLLVKEQPNYAIKNIALFKLGDELKAKWLYYYLSNPSVQNYFESIASGTSQHFIGLGHLRRLKIDNLHSSSNKIVSILSAYDNLIENNNKRIRLLEQMAENLYKEWFVRFRFPGHENAAFENGLPKGWKRVKICDVCNVTDGVHNTVIDAPQSKYFLLSSKNIKAGKIVIGDNERTIDEDTFIKLRKRTKMSKGDILLSSVGTIGEVCLLNEEPLYYEFQRSVAIIKPDFSISNSCLLYEMFKVMRNDFVNAAHGAAQQCLFIGDLKKMKICLPSKTISDIFERKVRPIYNMISSISKQNENLSRQRDLLLPRLMSGKLEVK